MTPTRKPSWDLSNFGNYNSQHFASFFFFGSLEMGWYSFPMKHTVSAVTELDLSPAP